MKDFDIFIPDKEKNIAVHKVAYYGKKGPHCLNVDTGLIIDTDGMVSPCCNIDFENFSPKNEFYFGNIFDEGGVSGAFHSKKARDFRERYRKSNGQLDRCRYCRHNLSIAEKQPMESVVEKYDYKTMLTGTQREESK